MKRWKAFAGAALVAALVLTPLTTMGAYAEEGDEPVPDKVFICKYTGKPGVDETLQGGGNPVNSSISSIKGEFPEGHVIQVGDTFGDDHGRSVIIAFDTGQDPEPTIADCAPPDGPDEVTPPMPAWVDECGEGNGHWVTPQVTGVIWDTDNDAEGNFYAYADPAPGFVFPEDAVDTWVEQEEYVDPCITEYPVPAAFNADPEPATCDAAGSFSTAFLGDREPIDSGEGWATYEYENVYIQVDRTVDGEVSLFIWPKEGYVITGTEGWTQIEDEDGVYYYRTIQIPDQLSDPELCPLAELPAPGAPTFTDACGIANDEYTVPDDTAEYFYDISEEGDTVFIEVIIDTGEDTFPEGTTTEWEFTFTDQPCPTSTPTPATPVLAATGGPNMTPWGIGAALMLIAGTALLTARRLARR